MEIRDVERQSIKILVVLLIGSFFFRSLPISTGVLLGYVLSLIIFRLDQLMVDSYLGTGSKVVVRLVIVSYILKMLTYTLGFILAVKNPKLLNIFGVAVGYLTIKLTIFYLGYKNRNE